MNRIPIGIVGLNWGLSVIREQILDGPASRDFRLAAVCARERDKTEACAREFGVRAYHDYEDLLRDESIPVVGLMSGPFGRAELIRRAVEAGKHVMTTKPIELDPEAALDVLRLARSLGRIIHLNSPSPLPSPDIRQILDWKADLGLGRPIAARADIWANYRECEDGSWYDDPHKCPVAPIFRLGIYLINDLVRLLGNPEEVSVMSSSIFTGRTTPDNAQLSLRFADGVLANIFSSFCINDTQWWLSSLTLNFENGTVYRNVGPVRGPEARKYPELSVVTNRSGKNEILRAISPGSNEDYQWDVFANAIRNGLRTDEISVEQIVAGVLVIRAMGLAARSGLAEKVVQPSRPASPASHIGPFPPIQSPLAAAGTAGPADARFSVRRG